MAGIKITPEELKGQAAQMTSLQSQYESLFRSVASELNGMNQNWSSLLANNFVGKINSAQKGFSVIESILQMGATAALQSAKTMKSMDSALAKMFGDDAMLHRGGSKSISAHGGGGKKLTVSKSNRPKAKTEKNSWLKSVGKAVKKKASKVSSKIKKDVKNWVNDAKQLVEYAKESYNDHGLVYKVVEYGKAAVKVVAGATKAAVAIGTIAGTGGLGTVAAVAAFASGCNDIWNAVDDVKNIHNENYEKVGKTNALKNIMEEFGASIGEELGNEELGKAVGNKAFYGLDLVGTIYSLGTSYDKLKQATPSNFSKVGSELKQVGHVIRETNVGTVLTTDISTLRYHAKLASYTFSETGNLIKNTGLIVSYYDNLNKSLKSGYEFLTSGKGEYTGIIKNVEDAIGVVGKANSYLGKSVSVISKVDAKIVDNIELGGVMP
ncbi:MAG: WXG100 family type VII secretion target [Roseburia sp.]|nr:WXG100 family type VII secretion target [Roseburia sp.]